jgi:hypothetical protein
MGVWRRPIPLAVGETCFRKHSIIAILSFIEQIACLGSFASASGNSGAICALFQNGASGTLSDALSFLNQIQSHGCKVCGSVPTNPGNDVSTGELTVNFISTPGGDGVDDDGEFEQFDGDGNDSDNDFGGSTAGLAGGDDGGDVEKRRVSAMFGRRKVFEA